MTRLENGSTVELLAVSLQDLSMALSVICVDPWRVTA